jgi:2-succinyl-5-enolpyruvyl-6-hydroxy-3-cyclohexene-1-carboxylate synthase
VTDLPQYARGSNANVAWAMILVDELALCGLRNVCIAPGSRSTPLTITFAAHPSIRVYRHLDERSAAFFALGLAVAHDEPAALVCTSGTAAANFYPAIVEAYQSHVPLLVLTADRPPELRQSGANQTIDQIKMYGDQVLWSVDVALPEHGAPDVAIRNIKTLAARAFAGANGLSKGPVHLNLPFRKPLEPASQGDEKWTAKWPDQEVARDNRRAPYTRFTRGVMTPAESQIGLVTSMVAQADRGLIVCGPRCQGHDFPEAVSEFSRHTGFPLLADPLSGVRFGPHGKGANIIGGYDTFLPRAATEWEQPELVIRFGDVPTSKSLNDYLDSVGAARRIHISENGSWADDSHRVNEFIHADPTLFCRLLTKKLAPRRASAWALKVQEAEVACWTAMDVMLSGAYCEGAIVTDMIGELPSGTVLFAGNSLPVRHLDQFGRPQLKRIRLFANRGASGIDGNVSTALGICASSETLFVAIVGDITFYHDLNGLLAVESSGLNPIIVLLNNNGGGIFHRLPIREFEPPFTELFVTPHGLDFEPVARMYGLDFVRIDDRNDFRRVLAESIESRAPRVIEVVTDSGSDEAFRKELIRSVQRRISAS